MNSEFKRPLPTGHENVNYKNHLELRYLRWDYLVKAPNPSSKVLRSKEKIIRYVARKAFFKYQNEFGFMKMDIEDVENICRTHTVSYLGLYSIDRDAEKLNRYRNRIKERSGGQAVSSKDLVKKDNYSLMSFLEQRLTECASLLRSYSKSDAGFNTVFAFVRKSGNLWPSDDELVQNPKKFGWEALPWIKFTKIKDQFGLIVPGMSKEIDGVMYRIASPENALIYSDHNIGEIVDSPVNSPMNPEELMIEMEEAETRKVNLKGVMFNISRSERLTNLIEAFYERPPQVRLRILKRFLGWLERRNGFQEEMAEEIVQVKSMIKKVKKDLLKDRLAHQNEEEEQSVG